MNFLIVVPRMVNRVGDFYQFPQGIAYISSMLTHEGFNLHKLNLNHINRPIRDILKEYIKNLNIDVVLTGGLTGQYGGIRSVIEEAKKIRQNIYTIVGGGIVTSAPLYAMQALEFADFGIIGEGEHTVCKLCHALETGRRVEDIPGIIYATDQGTYVETNGIPAPVDLDRIPFPDYEGLCLDDLLKMKPNIIGMGEDHTFPIITSRGCPFHCTFCFHPSSQKYRRRSLDNVFAEIDHLIRRYDIRYLSIQDELFGHDREWVERFCARIKPYGIRWFAQFRVTEITRDLVAMLKDAHCATIGVGVESADNRILKRMKKNITIEDTERALEIVHNAGIGIQGCLIFGDPAETIETAKKSIRWWHDHIHYGLQLSVVVTYPGTELFSYAMNRGLIDDPVQFIKDSCPTVKLSSMTIDEYGWILEEILRSQRCVDAVPEKIHSIDVNYEKASISITGTCASCRTENRWENIRLFIAESIVCSACGRRHYAPIPEEIISRISWNIMGLLSRYKKIAFWGINSYFYGFCERLSPELREHPFLYCVDKASIRYGIRILGKKVMPTDIINKEAVPCVIVAVPQYYANLKPMIESEFHGVFVTSITELLSSSFCESIPGTIASSEIKDVSRT